MERSRRGASGGTSIWTRGNLHPQQLSCGESTASRWTIQDIGAKLWLDRQGQERECSRKGPFHLKYFFSSPSSPPSGWLPVAPGTPPPLLWASSLGRIRADGLWQPPTPFHRVDGLMLAPPGPSSPCSALSPGTGAGLPGSHWWAVLANRQLECQESRGPPITGAI